MNLRELVGKIGFEVDEHPLERVEGLLEGIKHRMELLAGAELVAKLYEVAERFAEWGEELHVAAENAGMTVGEMQELTYAAEKSGVAAGEMSRAIAILSRHLYAARTGSKEAQQAFSKAGITGAQVKGFKTAKDALFALSDVVAKIPDPIKRMGVAQELLGRGGNRLITMLSKGSAAMQEQGKRARELGLVLSGPQVEALVQTEHAFQDLHAVLRAVGAMIASTIGPVFVKAIDLFLQFYAANKLLISNNIHNWLKSLAYGFGFVFGLVRNLIGWVIKLSKEFGVSDDMLKYAGWIAGAISGLTTLGIAFSILSGLFSMVSPFLAFAAAAGAIILAVHDLWAAMNDRPTWLGQAGEWKGLDAILNKIREIKDKFAAMLTGDLGKIDIDAIVSSDLATKIADVIAQAIDVALIATGYVFTVGAGIAAGFIRYLLEQIPGAAGLFKLNEEGQKQEAVREAAKAGGATPEQAESTMDRIARFLFEGFAPGGGGIIGAGVNAASGASTGTTSSSVTTNHIAIQLPPGASSPQDYGDAVSEALNRHDERKRREAARDLA